jgi:membrane-associated phospholipid phosphatase
MRYVLPVLVPLIAIALTIAGSRALPRLESLHRVEAWLFSVAQRFHTERKIALSSDVSALGSSTIVTAIAGAGAAGLIFAGRARDGVVVASASALAAISGTWLKRVTRRTRPEGSKGSTFGSSFPSSHTLMGTTLWLTLGEITATSATGLLRTWLWGVAITLCISIGLSRVFSRAHFLSDVLAGWAVGAALAYAAALVRAPL